MKSKLILILVLAIFPLIFTACELPQVVEEEEITPVDDSTSSTWMYTSNSGGTWFVYKLYFNNKLFAASSFNLENPYASILAVGNRGTIIRSDDGGGNWEVDTVGIMKIDLNALCPTGQTYSGIAVGNQGSILWSNDEGLNWTYMTTPVGTDLLSVDFDTLSGLGIAAGKNETIIHTYNRGLSWSAISNYPSSPVILKSVEFASSVVAVCAGYDENTNQPVLLRSDNGGITWINIAIPGLTNTRLNGVSFMDSLNGIAVGSGGIILKTIDGGLNWVLKNSGVTDDLYSVNFPPEVCMISGYKVILTSFDYGESWYVNRIGNANGILYNIFRLGPNNFFVAGD